MTEKLVLGQIVEIISASMGWGMAQLGMTGVIVDLPLDQGIISLELENGRGKWNCCLTDIKPTINKKEHGDTAAKLIETMQFVHKYHSRITAFELERIRHKIRLSQQKLTRLESKERELLDLVNYRYSKNPPSVSWMEVLNMLFNFYEDITMAGILCVGITKSIITSWTGKSLDLGKFKVSISPKNIYIENLTKKINGKYDHPHISDCLPCWGSYYNQIKYDLDTFNYAYALYHSYTFLHDSIDSGSWYIHAKNWAIDIDERCKTCFELLQLCKCIKIQPITPPAVECPMSKEILKKGYDEFCKNKCPRYHGSLKKCTTHVSKEEEWRLLQ